MRRRTRYLLYGIAAAAAAALGLGLLAGHGVSAGELERDARERQKIDSAWSVSESVDSGVAALLFYDESRGGHTCAVYLREESALDPGYHFHMGGAREGISEGGVELLEFGGNGSAILSLNAQRVARVELTSSEGVVTVIEVDPDQPFAVALPAVGGSIAMYDALGEAVPFSCIIVG